MARKDSGRLSGPLGPILGFTAATVFGFVVVPAAAVGPFHKLVGNVDYRTWQVLIVLQACLWIYGAAYAIGVWRKSRIARPLPWTVYLAMVGLALAGSLPYLIQALYGSPTGFDWRTSVVLPRGFIASGAGLWASLIVGAGILRIQAIAGEYDRKESDLPARVRAYHWLSRALERHLLIIGGILAGMVVGTQASSKAIKAIDGVELMFPTQIWQMASYWSALLAVVYLASRASVRRVGYRLRDELLAEATAADGLEALERERRVDGILRLDQGYLAELQSALGVLTPIAGALASRLVA